MVDREENDKRLKDLQEQAAQAAADAHRKIHEAIENLEVDGSSFCGPNSDVEARIMDTTPMPQETMPGKPTYHRPMVETAAPRALLRHYLNLMEKEGLIIGVREVEDRLLECVLECVKRVLEQTQTPMNR